MRERREGVEPVGKRGRLRDRDQDHKAAKRGRTSFNNDAVPDSSLVSTPLASPTSSYTLTDLLPLNDSFQIGVRRLEPRRDARLSVSLFVFS